MRSGPGSARTILLFHIICARPSKQPRMVRTFLKVYMDLGSYFLFLQEQIKDIIIIIQLAQCHSEGLHVFAHMLTKCHFYPEAFHSQAIGSYTLPWAHPDTTKHPDAEHYWAQRLCLQKLLAKCFRFLIFVLGLDLAVYAKSVVVSWSCSSCCNCFVALRENTLVCCLREIPGGDTFQTCGLALRLQVPPARLSGCPKPSTPCSVIGVYIMNTFFPEYASW